MNTEADQPQEVKNNIINEFEKKLGNSGYLKKQVYEIIESGIVSFERRKETLGGVTLRDPLDTAEEKEYKNS